MTPVRMDDKGRLVIPRAVREALNLQAGDVLFVEFEQDGDFFRVARAANPFDVMGDYAVREFEAGRTMNLRDYAASEGYVIDDHGKVSRGAPASSAEGSGESTAVGS
ncbi:MAG: AbrB/MazE/SpoVT family DNA-binding domain-containing protein [Chloroflexota bacterium]|nr:AbrB/MazE/SpoVT family DNA-binding domain-containing protein [Chloroflexota bacterium]